MPTPPPAYNRPPYPPTLPPLNTLSAAPKTLLHSHRLPPRSGHAWPLRAGQVCRIVTTAAGPQVGDLNLWSLHDRRERFWAARTRQLQASHVQTGDRLWSCLPWLRGMCLVTGDPLGDRLRADGAGASATTAGGGRLHDLLGTRCDPYVNRLLTGQDFDYHCHSNLVRAVAAYGLAETDVHDVLNVFQVTGLNARGEYFMEPCPARPGDYFEFLAEIDLLCALSTCPGGDLSRWAWGEGQDGVDMTDCCRPLDVEVYEFEDKSILKDWELPRPPEYGGQHGMKRESV